MKGILLNKIEWERAQLYAVYQQYDENTSNDIVQKASETLDDLIVEYLKMQSEQENISNEQRKIQKN